MSTGVDAINQMVAEAAAQQQQHNETPEEKAAREAAAQETPEQKAARELEAQNQETPEEKAAREAAAQQQPEVDPVLQELYKEHGVSNAQELREKLAKKEPVVEETPEQKAKKEEVYRAAMISYAVDNDLLKIDDITRLDQLTKMPDKDLVFEKFAESVREEILDELSDDATEEDIIKAVDDAFEKEYPLNSKSDKARERAEKKLAKEAEEIRGPLKSSFNNAKSRFDEERSLQQSVPVYNKSMSKSITSLVPEKITFFSAKDGDEDVNAEIVVTEEDKKFIVDELTKRVTNNPATYLLFKEGKEKEIQELLKEQYEIISLKRFNEAGKAKVAEIYMSRGLAKGSEVGAKNSFATNQAAGSGAGASGKSAEEMVLDSTRVKK